MLIKGVGASRPGSVLCFQTNRNGWCPMCEAGDVRLRESAIPQRTCSHAKSAPGIPPCRAKVGCWRWPRRSRFAAPCRRTPDLQRPPASTLSAVAQVRIRSAVGLGGVGSRDGSAPPSTLTLIQMSRCGVVPATARPAPATPAMISVRITLRTCWTFCFICIFLAYIDNWIHGCRPDKPVSPQHSLQHMLYSTCRAKQEYPLFFMGLYDSSRMNRHRLVAYRRHEIRPDGQGFARNTGFPFFNNGAGISLQAPPGRTAGTAGFALFFKQNQASGRLIPFA